MRYEIRDGLIEVTSQSTDDDYVEPSYEDPFLLKGQCLLALVAAGLGGLLAPLVCDRRREQDG
jgi:hypothetical protein